MQLEIKTTVQLFNDDQLRDLLAQALSLLERTPFTIQGTDEVFDLLTAYGCTVQGDKVTFPPSVIDKVMDRCEKERRSFAKQPEAETPPHLSDVTVFTHGQALHICDPETNRLRQATTRDLAEWCHLVESLGVTSRAHPTFIPTDGPVGSADFRAFGTIILNSSRPYRVSVYSADMLPFFIEACTIAQGALETVKRDPIFAAKAWVTSPFMLDRENIDIAMEARRRLGLPVQFGQMPVAGASTPITVSGALVQNTAESLAISALRLAIDDLPHHVTGSSAIMDMRHGFPRQIGPDLFLHYVAGREMDDFLYRGRRSNCGWGWCGAGAATVSTQSLMEKALGFGMGMAMGARSFGVGCLAFSDVGSPVQLIIDLDLADYARMLFRGVTLDEEHVGMDTITNTIPTGGRYLETMHTAQFFREACWLPGLWDFRAFLAWANNPNDVIEKATQRCLDARKSLVNPCPLSAEKIASIRKLMAEADAKAR